MKSTPAPVSCCATGSIGVAESMRDSESCKQDGATLVCVDGDPSQVIGVHQMPNDAIAIQTHRQHVCGGMARGTRTAWWVTLPAHREAAIVRCSETHEDCSGPPRP